MEMKNVSSEQMDKIWQKFLTILVGENWEFSEYVTGVRIVDRQKKYQTLKIEIWTVFGFTNKKFTKEERTELKENFRNSMHEKINEFYQCYNNIFFTEHARKLN